jgi:transposase
MTDAPASVPVDFADIQGMLERTKQQVSAGDHALMTSVVKTLVEVTRLARTQGTTLARLRHFLGQTSSEKTAKVLGKDVPAPASEPPSDEAGNSHVPGATSESTPPAPANDTGAGAADKPRRKGHGRNGASAYTGCQPTRVQHEHLHAGQQCPACARGRIFAVVEPSVTIRVFGQMPLVALRWDCERLRCGACLKVYTAPLPEPAQGPKYDDTAASMIIVLHYGSGMPFHRLDGLQGHFGVPMPASTQWQIVYERFGDVLPVYDHLIQRGANGDVLYEDDTGVRILELAGKRRASLLARGGLDLPDRTGLFTTAIVAKTEDGLIALFASGRQHAGENLADLLDLRDERLPTPIQMCDGLERNTPDDHPVLEANCLTHGRRHVVDEVSSFPEHAAHMLEQLGKVFANERQCRAQALTGLARLAFHQAESAPIMEAIRRWMLEQLDDKRVEPNSGLGGAFAYLLKRWDKLTLFLRVRDAPIDNNLAERTLKMAIRLRNASLFYRSRRGAFVGDVYMTLIFTTELHGGDPFRYLTALFSHAKDVAASPADWLPWNYEATLQRLAVRPAA